MRITALFLLAGIVAAEEPATDPAAEWAALTKEYNAAVEAYYKPYRDAKTDGERDKIRLDPAQNPDQLFLPRYKEYAIKYAGREEAVSALIAITRSSRDEGEKTEAFGLLLTTHVQSPKMADAVFSLRSAEQLRTLIGKSKDHTVQGRAHIRLADMTRESAPEEAADLYEKAKSGYGDVLLYGTRTVGAAADGALFELRNLAVGKTAPEIEGTDLEGKAFKLSDYRGKVILLDFWGDW